jgi:DNA-binding NarL/FixJ family response regulator
MATILLLEDSPQFVSAAQRSLAAHVIVHVATVDAAIDALSQGNIDCALIDLNLTDSDDWAGAELLAHMQIAYPSLPRAVVTGSRLRGGIYKNLMQKYGVSEVVIKGDLDREGFATTDLVDSVNSLLNRSDSMSRSSAEAAIRENAQTALDALSERIEVLNRILPGMGPPRRRNEVRGSHRRRLEADMRSVEAIRDRALLQVASVPVAQLVDLVESTRLETATVWHG